MPPFDYDKHLFAETADLSLSSRNLMALKMERLLDLLERQRRRLRVLELGCGVANLTRLVKVSRPEITLVGLDISKNALEVARRASKDVFFVRSDVLRLPFEDASFDLVYGFDIVEHIPCHHVLFSEIGRVLTPRGIAHLHVPCEGEPFTLWWILRKVKVMGHLKEKYAGHVQRFTIDGVKSDAASSGFSVEHALYSFHLFGQLLDFVQWAGASLRQRRSDHSAPGNGASRTGAFSLRSPLGLYRLITHVLGTAAFYESKRAKGFVKPMCIDLTLRKRIDLPALRFELRSVEPCNRGGR